MICLTNALTFKKSHAGCSGSFNTCSVYISICTLVPFLPFTAPAPGARTAQLTGAHHPVCCSHTSRLSAAEALRWQQPSSATVMMSLQVAVCILPVFLFFLSFFAVLNDLLHIYLKPIFYYADHSRQSFNRFNLMGLGHKIINRF
jgi:hypothetical protein